MNSPSPNKHQVVTKAPITLITGGSDGIGRALAEKFAERGDQLLLVARNVNNLRIAADELERKWGREVHIASIDLMEQGATRQLMHDIEVDNFYVEHLINCAGIGFIGKFADGHIDGIKALIQLNLSAPTELTHICLQGMLERNSGGILNIASLSGMVPLPNLTAYSASKSYLIAFTRALAEELRGSNVNASVLLPGPVETNFLNYASTSEARLQNLIPMSTPESVARVGYEGYLAGQTIITPGFLNVLYRFAIKIIPLRFLVRSMNAVFNLAIKND